ncbi:hypothetical protein RCL_jg10209.t1 [Rhizophagus clarus]|uniref:Uncharacterized protein n=1 Tax=Rhizophagus clarus TaxID=94130 RepID=A0A8H3KTK7_9GLOM|nr:hypothetical protein RCL_jg10209.t1 [Rhizophagus clarus]
MGFFSKLSLSFYIAGNLPTSGCRSQDFEKVLLINWFPRSYSAVAFINVLLIVITTVLHRLLNTPQILPYAWKQFNQPTTNGSTID